MLPPNMVCGRKRTVFVLLVRASVRPCMRPETLLTRYLAEYLTHFHQTYRYTNDTLWDRDEHFTVLNEKVKGQGHSGIKYAGSSTFWAC